MTRRLRRVGRPYTITATMPGLATAMKTDVFMSIGEAAGITVTMQPDTINESM